MYHWNIDGSPFSPCSRGLDETFLPGQTQEASLFCFFFFDFDKKCQKMIQENIKKIHMNNYFPKRSAYCNMVATSIIVIVNNIPQNYIFTIFKIKCLINIITSRSGINRIKFKNIKTISTKFTVILLCYLENIYSCNFELQNNLIFYFDLK